MLFKKLSRKTQILLSLQSIAMLIGMSTHILWIIKNGFLSPAYQAPLFSAFFWDSLSFTDPIAAILLILNPQKGLLLTAIIISVDVLHNIIFSLDAMGAAFFSSCWIKQNWMLIAQFIFGLFVILTFKSNMKDIKSQSTLLGV